MTSRDIWQDRPVAFVEFSVRDGDRMHEGFEESNAEGSYQLLVLSLRWADTKEPVFKTAEEIWQQPYKLRPVLARLVAKAAFINGLSVQDPDAPEPAQANGHDAAPGPSL